MHDLLKTYVVYSTLPTPTGANGGSVDFNATGDKFIFTAYSKATIKRFGFVTDAAMDPDAGGFVIAIDRRPTAGSDTNRVEVATITRADAQLVAAGQVIYRDIVIPDLDGEIGEDGKQRNVAPTGLTLNPGEQAVVEVTNAVGAASTGIVFLEIVEGPIVKVQSNTTVVTV